MLQNFRRSPTAAFIVSFCAGALAFVVAASSAQSRSLSLIRDAEIETIIGSYSTPLFAAAGLDPRAVEIKIVRSRDINAFVAGGQRVFIYTGLLLKADNPEEVKGVIAHEVGHIAGGHLARLHDRLRRANSQAIISTLIGLAAAIGAGNAGAGAAVIGGGAQVAQRSLLQYSRVQESAADQAGLRYLNASGVSTSGMLSFLEKLANQEALQTNRQDSYVLTHPLARERVALLRDQISRSPYRQKPPDPQELAAFERMKAKLGSFLNKPSKTFRQYPSSDRSQTARYARSIAHHKSANFPAALDEVDSLIAELPNDPFFFELKGQILFESGQVSASIEPLSRAVEILPDAPMLRFGLARAQIATNDATQNRAAIDHLRVVVDTDRDAAGAWRELAVAYGRDGSLGMSALSSAEFNIRIGRKRDAKGHAGRALRLLPQGSPGWLRAQDIEFAAGKKRK